jgi:hypothetical protein
MHRLLGELSEVCRITDLTVLRPGTPMNFAQPNTNIGREGSPETKFNQRASVYERIVDEITKLRQAAIRDCS